MKKLRPRLPSSSSLRKTRIYELMASGFEAFPEETAPRFLPTDRDSIYGEYFRSRVAGMGVEEVVTAGSCDENVCDLKSVIHSVAQRSLCLSSRGPRRMSLLL